MVLMEALDHQKKGLEKMFCLSLHYNADDNYLFVNGKEILNLKLAIKMLTLQLIFFSEVFLMDLVLLNLEKYL